MVQKRVTGPVADNLDDNGHIGILETNGRRRPDLGRTFEQESAQSPFDGLMFEPALEPPQVGSDEEAAPGDARTLVGQRGAQGLGKVVAVKRSRRVQGYHPRRGPTDRTFALSNGESFDRSGSRAPSSDQEQGIPAGTELADCRQFGDSLSEHAGPGDGQHIPSEALCSNSTHGCVS